MIKRLAIGPIRDYPSWDWVGEAVARELADDYEIALFRDFWPAPRADAVMVIKQRPPKQFVRALRTLGSKLVYLPIDIYNEEREIHQDAAALAACDLVLSHSEPLLDRLGAYCARTAFVEHHGKYTTPELLPYRPDGFVLWVGGLQNLPYLLKWLEEVAVTRELELLTDIGNPSAVRAAQRLARRIGVRLRIEAGRINGIPAHAWSEAKQHQMMRACKAAIDIKGGDFNQRMKPPAKAQKFVSSGIPLACNADGAAAAYFRARGFELATPAAEDRWYSHDYWRETQRFANELRETISIEAVARRYRQQLASLWVGSAA